MRENRYGGHTVTQLTVHLVWVTKYRYAVLKGDIQLRVRELIRQICDANDVRILKGVVSRDHVHLHIAKPPSLAESELVRRIKGRTGRKLLIEYPELKKRYWGGHLWGIGYGAWSTGVVSEELISEYLEHHRERSNKDDDEAFIIGKD